MKEAVFSTEIVNSLKSFGWKAHKLGDSVPTGASRFIQVKPCDIIACSPKGRYVEIENKQFKKWQGFSHKCLRENQVEALDDTLKKNGRAFLLVNVRIKPQSQKGIKKENACVIFDWFLNRHLIMGEGFSIKQMREKSVGVWKYSFLNENKKRIWSIKNILVLNEKK